MGNGTGMLAMGGDGQTIDIDAAQALYKQNQAKKKKVATTTSSTKTKTKSKGDTKVSTKYLDKYKEMNPNAVEGKDYYIEDKVTSDKNLAKKIGSTLEKAVEENKGFVDSKSKTKKPGGTLSYKDSYTDAVASKWESKGGYDAYEKAAKAWNKKKYGTTEPTSTAKAGGITKKELAKKHANKPEFKESLIINGVKTDVKDLGSEYTTVGVMAPKPSPIDTSNNASLANTIGKANSSDSLLGGVKTRRETRQANRQQRQRSREQRKNLRQTGNKFVSKKNRQEASDKTKALMGPKNEKKVDWKSSLSNKTLGM